MTEVVLLSDLHGEVGHLVELKKDHLNAWWFATGDSTNGGTKDEYRRIWSAFTYLVPHLAVPGNHDYGRAGNLYTAKAAHRFDKHLTGGWFGQRFFNKKPAIRLIKTKMENILVIGLNSCIKTTHPFDFASGRIGLKQRMWLKWLLWYYRDVKTKIVLLHHHPFLRNNFTMCLHDWKKFMEIVAGKIDVLAFGHAHRRDRFPEQEREYQIPVILASGSPKCKDLYDRKLWKLMIYKKDIEVSVIDA